jgi:DHA2 family multidrug resistance protein-like MFS transporter
LLIAAPLLVPESRDPNPGRIDAVSIVLSMAAMIPVVYAIKSLAVDGPSLYAGGWALLGIVMGVLFVRRQLRAEIPMLDMALFRRGTFSGAILVNLLSVVALVGFLYFVSQHLQLVLGLSPMVAGLALVPGMVAMIIAGLGVVPISRRVAPHIVVPAALVFSVAGYLIVAFTSQADGVVPLVVAFVVLGIGIGAAETISNELILSSAPAAKVGAASAVSETAYELGAVLGTAVLGGLITAFYRGALVLPDGLPGDIADAARETLAGAYIAAEKLPAQVGTAVWDAAATAFGSGVMLTSLIGAGLVVLAGVIAAVTLRTRTSH